MLDMGFREDLEEILDATPRRAPHAAVLGDHAARRSSRSPSATSATRCASRPSARIAAMATSPIRRSTVAPADIEHAVVNLLRFHEAETAMLFCATRDNVRHLHASLVERGFAAVALSGEHQPERAQPGAAGAARPARAGLRRDRRRRARHRSADAQPGRPCRAAARCRDAAAPLGPHRPRGQEGHRGADRALSAPQPRRDRCCAARGSRPNGSTPPTARGHPRAAIASGCSPTLLAPVEVDDEDRALGRATCWPRRSPEEIAAALVHAHRARDAAARGADRPTRPPQRAAAHRSATARASRTRSGSAWTSAAARMPIRAGSCRCSAAAATSPSNEIGAIRIGPNETLFQIPRAIAGKFADAAKRTAAAELAAGEESLSIEPSESGPREVARHNRREGPSKRAPNDGPPRGKPKVHRKGKHPHNANRPPKTYSDRKPKR